jgi:hypothetical protein
VIPPVIPSPPADPNANPRIQGMIGIGLGKIKKLHSNGSSNSFQIPGGSSVHLNIKQVAQLLRSRYRAMGKGN